MKLSFSLAELDATVCDNVVFIRMHKGEHIQPLGFIKNSYCGDDSCMIW